MANDTMGNMGKGAAAGAAFGPYGAAIGAGLGALGGGLFGGGGPDYNSIFGDIDIPALEELVKAGKIDATSFDTISEDPALRAAQMQSLNAMAEEGNRGGASIQSKAAQGELLDKTATTERMNREAVLSDMARRGQLGGSQELAARMMANQEGARTAGLQTARIAADDRTRALQALQGAGQQAGNVRGQDYQVASQRASAEDKLKQWNAENQRNAYTDRMQWQMQKASGRAGLAPQQYQRAVNTGAGIGALAGGALDYFNSRPKTEKSDVAGGDWGAGQTDTAGGYSY